MYDTLEARLAGAEKRAKRTNRRCDCESLCCHPQADCKGHGTVKTIYSTICTACAANMPSKYLKHETNSERIGFDNDCQ